MIIKDGLHKLLNLNVEANAATVIIYCDNKTERLNYVCEFIFNTVLKTNYNITNSIDDFNNSTHYKINYSNQLLGNTFQIAPFGLLFENTITEVKPSPFFKNDLIYFFEKKTTDFHFDIFSAVFYFISRLEEWQSFDADTHQRFEAKNSILFQHQFHLKPVVELWLEEFKTELQNFYPNLLFPKKQFKAISTIDVDNLFAFKHKGFVRTLGAICKDILNSNYKLLSTRLNVLRGKQKDPFDIYDSISEFCLQNNIPLLYFFLFKTGTKYDRTVNPNSSAFKEIFKLLSAKKAIIGIHPSYNSSTNEKMLQHEFSDFSKTLDQKVIISRQHYLRFNIKTTPDQLFKNGIIADFTMGFASEVGFRAGTSHPFYYYNFHTEQKSELIFVPFCAMDGAYLIYNNVPPNDVLNSLLKLANEIKKVNGLFITVFHERTFYNELYKGLGEIYIKLHSEMRDL